MNMACLGSFHRSPYGTDTECPQPRVCPWPAGRRQGLIWSRGRHQATLTLQAKEDEMAKSVALHRKNGAACHRAGPRYAR